MLSENKSGVVRFFQPTAKCKSTSFWLLIMGLLLALQGCDRELQRGYGRARGAFYSDSINGTYIFHRMIESVGYDVDRYKKFSPRWEKYQTVFWIPDDFKSPSEELVDRIETWLANQPNRTIVLVARDFDATPQYWKSLQTSELDPEKARYFERRWINALTESMFYRQFESLAKNPWYSWEDYPYRSTNQFSGEMVEETDLNPPAVVYRSLPTPHEPDPKDLDDYESQVLLEVDGHPFIFRLTRRQIGSSQIIVVGNASFLLNLPLTQRSNQRLAEELIYLATADDYLDEVLFIEGGGDLPISDRDIPDIQSEWSWITKKPLRYIVPNLLFCCILFCFVYFPIFGRPKKVKQRSTSNFRDHVDALGQLLSKTESQQILDDWIADYKKRTRE